MELRVSRSFVSLLLFLGAFFLYLGTFSCLYTYDGIVWSMLFENQALVGRWRFETPHYMAFFGIGQSAYFLARAVSQIRAIDFLQIFSAFFAALGLTLLEHLLYRMQRSARARFVALAAVGASPTFWKFASTPETYAMTIAFFVGALILLEQKRGSVANACASALPILAHQSLATLAIARVLSCAPKDRRAALVEAAASFGIFLFAAIIAYAVSDGLWKPFPWWLSGLAQSGSHSILNREWSNPGDAVRALLVRPAGELSVALWAGWGLVALAMAGLWRDRREHAHARLLLWFVATHTLAISLWAPLANDFWVFLVVPFAVGLAHIADRHSRIAIPLCFALMLNFGTTYWIRVLPELRIESNLQLARAREIRSRTLATDIVVLPGCGETSSDKVYVPYFAGRQSLYVDWILATPGTSSERLARLDAALRAAAERGRVILVRELLDDPTVADSFEREHGVPRDDYQAFIRERIGRDSETGFWIMPANPGSH